MGYSIDPASGLGTLYSIPLPLRAAWDRAACNSSRTPITARFNGCVHRYQST